MTAARPPGLSSLRNKARKSSSVFLVLTTPLEILGGGVVVQAPRKRWVGQDQRVFLGIGADPLGQESR